MNRISVRALHKPLADAGLVPENCRVLSLTIGVDGPLVVTYEMFLTPAQLAALGRIFQTVGEAADEARS